MTWNYLSPIFLRATALVAITAAALAGGSMSAQADYVPPGGEPPTGRTSTSGMSF